MKFGSTATRWSEIAEFEPIFARRSLSVGSDADVFSMRTRGPRSYWRAAGAGYTASTMPPRRHAQIPAPGAAIPLMDGRIRISACSQRTAYSVFDDQPQQVRRIQH